MPEASVRPAGPAFDSARPAAPAVARQHEEEMAVEGKLAALQLKDTVDRFLPQQRMHDFRHKPETEIEQVEHGKSSHHVFPDLSYREEPLTKQDMEIKGEESLPRDQPHDSVPERR